MSNFGHFLLLGGGAMSLAEYQHVNGFRAGLLLYMKSFMQIGQCIVKL